MGLSLFAVLVLLWLGPLWRPRPLPGVTRPRPYLLGHRGLRGRFPDNSLPAFEAAFKAGLDGVECDVQRSRDGELVLYHDVRIAGREVSALTLDELERADGAVITLGALLALARDYPGTLLNLEIKAERLGTRALVRDLARQVRASGLADRVLVSSFNPWSLLELRLLAPELRTGLLFEPDLPWLLRGGVLAGLLHVDALHPHESQVDAALMARARRRALLVNVWTVNDPARVRALLAFGVDGLIADDPAALRRAAGRGAS